MRSRRLFRIQWWGLFCLAGVLTLVARADQSSYFLNPMRMEVRENTKTHVASGVIQVFSNAEDTVKLRAVAKQWTLDAKGEVIYPESLNPPGVEAIRLNPVEFELPPGKTRLIRFGIPFVSTTASDTASDEERRFQVFFYPVTVLKPEGPSAETESMQGVQAKIATVPVFATTIYAYRGHPTPRVQITDLHCVRHPTEGIKLSVTLNNVGQQHARLVSSVVIKPGTAAPAEPPRVKPLLNHHVLVVVPGAARQLNATLIKPDENDWSQMAAGTSQLELHLLDERNSQPEVVATCPVTAL